MGYGNLWMMLIMILVWVLIIGGAVWLVAVLFPKWRTSSDEEGSGDTPLTILQRRYARGELTREEYEAIRRNLEQ